MNRIFTVSEPFQVPDGTFISPFLNSKDCISGLPFSLLDGASLSIGIIKGHTKSKIHVMPFVTQITYVTRGYLDVKMKGFGDSEAYRLSLEPKQAIITEPGVFFQLINDTDWECEVLYVVTPAYLFEVDEEKLVYDDSVILDETWDELKTAKWYPQKRLQTLDERQAAYERLKKSQQ